MKRIQHLLVFAALFFGTIHPAAAMVESQLIHVISFTPAEKPDRYTIVFDAETTDDGKRINLPRKKRRFTVQLRCDPRFCRLDQYRDAVQLLRWRIEQSPDVTIFRMSGRGWGSRTRQTRFA